VVQSLTVGDPEGLSDTSNATVDPVSQRIITLSRGPELACSIQDQSEGPSASNTRPAPSARSDSCSNCAEKSERIAKLEEERDAAANKFVATLEKTTAYINVLIAENTELRSANNALEGRLERIEATLSGMREEKTGSSEPSN
jgi:hypothetical protein